MNNNPFSLDFGAEPNLYIARNAERKKIIDTFSSKIPSTHIFLLLGARGTGKTVLMPAVSHELRDMDKWIHVDIGVESDMLNSLAANIYEKTTKKFPKIKVEINVKGISISAEKEVKYTDIRTDLDAMLKALDKYGIKVLITVDEVINSKNVREFTTYFQHAIREKLPLFCIMTGLYKNVRALQNDKSQTFLRRIPRIKLGALNLTRIAREYEKAFNLDHTKAYDMALFTGGYSYGFQILGYLTYDAQKDFPDEDILIEYKINLAECSYDKIWEELSGNEREVAKAIATSDSDAVIKNIREQLDMDSNNFSTYKNTLEKSGLLSTEASYGRVDFCLPFFREYVMRTN